MVRTPVMNTKEKLGITTAAAFCRFTPATILKAQFGLPHTDIKFSTVLENPFPHLRVHVKEEIIMFGQPLGAEAGRRSRAQKQGSMSPHMTGTNSYPARTFSC